MIAIPLPRIGGVTTDRLMVSTLREDQGQCTAAYYRSIHMRLISAILLSFTLLAGCNDSVDAPADQFWSGRGEVLFTQDLALENAGRVVSVDVDGSHAMPLFAGAIPCPPRNGKIVYADVTLTNNWTINLANANGSGTPVTLASGGGLQRPNFGIVDLTRSASKVLFALGTTNSTLYVVNADGTGQIPIASDVVISTAAAFSPNERQVAFYAGTDKNELKVVDLDNLRTTVVASNARPWSIENLDWSPDGSLIAFVGSEPRGGTARNIYVVSPKGTGLHRLTIDTTEENRWPVWSPDGQQLAYIHGTEIWRMKFDGSSPQAVTHESAWPYQVKMFPQWSPASISGKDSQSMILFTAIAGNGVQGLLQVVDLATLRVNAIATGAARGFWR
jgi:WD40 repeat protein